MLANTHKCARAVPLLLLAALGCATVDPEPDYDRARTHIEEATGEAQVYSPGDDAAVAERVSTLLAGGVSAEEAVEIALLNNRDLQAAFLEIGVARAEVVQSGLLSNPSLGALIRFPIDGGSSNAEAFLMQNLIELWHMPARKGLQERQLERQVFELAHQAAQLSAEAKAAYFSAVTSEQALTVEEENLAAAREFLDLTLARQQAGAATEVDVNSARAEHLDQEVFVRSARLAAFEAKRGLSLLLGLDLPPQELVLTGGLPEFPEWKISLERLVSVAKTHRLDLKAANQSVLAAEQAVRLEKRLFIRNVSVGVTADTIGDNVALGPAIDLDIPVFDQNQAQIAKAEFRHRQALKLLDALSVLSVQEVRGAHQRFTTSLGTARLYRERLLPLRESNLELARESFRQGKTGFLSVLEAQKKFLTTRREYIGELETLMLTLPELEASCGRPLPELLEASGQPRTREGAGTVETPRPADGRRPLT